MTTPKCEFVHPSWWVWTGGWYELNGENTYYINWPLTPESIVLDIGAYEGGTTLRFATRYKCKIYAFEPSPRAYQVAKERLKDLSTVTLLPYGLGVRDGTFPLGDSDRDGASFRKLIEKPIVQAEMREICKALITLGILDVDLAIINIEGSEYELMALIVKCKLVSYIKRFMIQWHFYTPEYQEQQLRIQTQLAQTHRMLWNLGAWEAWQIQEK